MLEVEDISVAYGDLQALWDVSLRVDAGEIIVLLGPNGAGKTTLMRSVAGLQPPFRGRITVDGEQVERLPPHRLVERGVVLVPEGRCGASVARRLPPERRQRTSATRSAATVANGNHGSAA